MDDLPLVLLNKELLFSLAPDKIKTLEKCKGYQKDVTKQNKINDLFSMYQHLSHRVATQFQLESSKVKAEFTSKEKVVHREDRQSINFILRQPSIIEIIGLKNSGKTALALKLAENYIQIHPQKIIKFLNCGAGMTMKRLQKLVQKYSMSYSDIFTLEDLQEILKHQQKSSLYGLLIIDSLVSLLLAVEKQKPIMTKIFEILAKLVEAGWTVIFTNLVQFKLETGEGQITNQPSYFSQYCSDYIQSKLYVFRREKNHFEISIIKSLENANDCYLAEIGQNEMGNLTIIK